MLVTYLTSLLIVKLVSGVLGFNELTALEETNVTVVLVAAVAGDKPIAAKPAIAAVATMVRIASFIFILSPLNVWASLPPSGECKKLREFYTSE
jgi:hypothetical protein